MSLSAALNQFFWRRSKRVVSALARATLLLPFLAFLAILHSADVLARPRAEFLGSAEAPRFFGGLELTYSQSSDVWQAINSLRGSKGSTARLEDTFRHRYGEDQDAFARLKVGLYDAPGASSGLFQYFTLEAVGEVSFWGITSNPVVSEIHGKLIGLGSLVATFKGSLPGSFLRTRLGATAGAGLGKRTDGISADLLGSMPQQNEDLRLLGVDLGLATARLRGSDWNPGAAIDYQGSVFFSSLTGRTETHRWKSRLFVHLHDAGPHLILGPQPLPIDLLVRSWDYLHPASRSPDIRALLGYGFDFPVIRTSGGILQTQLGSYGGFLGGGISWEGRVLQLKAGSWGIGLGPDFQGQPERIWQATFGTRF